MSNTAIASLPVLLATLNYGTLQMFDHYYYYYYYYYHYYYYYFLLTPLPLPR